MRRRETLADAGLWLAVGGLLLLAGHHLLVVYRWHFSVDSLLLLAGALAGYALTAGGMCLSLGCRPRRAAAAAGGGAAPVRTVPAPGSENDAARRMTETFLAWCEADLPETNPWSAFDQLTRELLTEQLGAGRVRCFALLPGSQQLQSLAQHEASGETRSARAGILGHVATTGREFLAGDPTHGQLVEQLAREADEPWEWIFPLRQDDRTVALVAVGRLPSSTALHRPLRQTLSVLLTLFWRHVAALERLRIAERTDKASGLLTRADFFDRAARALAESYAENEPVVVVAVTVEGLRHLDDAGRWSERDALVETIGHLIKRRIRTDDVIGRFSDDRFVVLLRRLDSGLGRLIAAKIQDTAQQQVARLGGGATPLGVRVGVVGSGFARRSLEALLAAALDAVEQARRQNVGLFCDLPGGAAGEACQAVHGAGG